jgi:membrane-bound lytic murein transglycosylase D
MADVTKFLEMEDSVYRYKADELLTRRAVVEINDDVPTFVHHKKKGRGSRATTKRGKRGRGAKVAATKRGKRGAAARQGGSKKKKGGAATSKKKKGGKKKRK